MNAKPCVYFAVTLTGLALAAFAQMDGISFASDLRAKFGPPLARETYTARPGVEIIIDYAASGRVCRIQFPPIAPGPEPGVKSTQAIDDLVNELVPIASRGKELLRLIENFSLASVSEVRYENVTVSEHRQS